MANNAAGELMQHLAARHLHPKPAWLQSFLSTTRPNTALAALKQTCLFRLLATDITTSLNQPAASVFPEDVLRGTVQSRFLAGPIICQVLDIEDIGQSRWSQVEAIEARERGEMTKGREIVRVIESENDDSGQAAAPAQTKGPFKLLLQDAKGLQVYAVDLRGIDGLNTNMSMGVKLLLRNIEVRRAVIMLEPGNVQTLGGKLEALDKAWKEGRKDILIKAANASGELAG
ncbi:RecQ mediated genome instability protein Rmi1 [Macroventuria anomochaeta]|uniref:RecQ mediated genome instability protein Rmi1 n=1 Tax=Macroventuria anomochaeta TaxID=301207 RepID=A0ACB6S798_9PLEO|nr:RecQ mediated genome instability protein Rmi1 [Macroventuria anomochaeta]KAF2630076.1 RecQ mediated genome instability protein Rmi1 [Macroventuria anomochaeta]